MRLERKGHLTPLADDILVVAPLPFASGSLERHDSAHWTLPQCHPPPQAGPPDAPPSALMCGEAGTLTFSLWRHQLSGVCLTRRKHLYC